MTGQLKCPIISVINDILRGEYIFMTVGQRIFFLLKEKKMTQVEFSRRTGIATTTISDWRKRNTNPGSEKIMQICAALDVTPSFLLSGVCEDSERGKNTDYMVIPRGTDERLLLELFSDLPWPERAHLLEYAARLKQKQTKRKQLNNEGRSLKKIAEFCDVEVYMDEDFCGDPSIEINYLDDDVSGRIDLNSGQVTGSFSKYVLPVIEAWLQDHREKLLSMWRENKIEAIPAWE